MNFLQVVILAAGKGTRMRPLTLDTNKCLLSIGNELILERMLHQISEYDPSKVVVVTGYMAEQVEEAAAGYHVPIQIVHNRRYAEDVNILSMHLSLEKLRPDETTVIIEADIILDELAVRDMMQDAKRDISIWYTRGDFCIDQYGGILKCDANEQITDLKIVKEYNVKYKNYKKLLGITIIGKRELNAFKRLVAEYASRSINQYWLIPWIENLDRLPCNSRDLNKYFVSSINTCDEYYTILQRLNQREMSKEYPVELVEVSKLKPIEGHISERVVLLREKIWKEGVWNRPIVVEKENLLVLDGNHRFQVAKLLQMERIPAILIDYNEIEVWSLRVDEFVSRDEVIRRALSGELYPHKTAKHKFPNFSLMCNISTEELIK
jgi:CTP:phosphocholine cytidylyltransferase-like protein